jgi:hypothetical protein
MKKIDIDRKRELWKVQQLDIKKQNDQKMKEKSDWVFQQKVEDKRLLDEYTKMLEKQEMDNRARSRVIKSSKPIPNEYYRNVADEKERELEMEKKYLVELEQIEKR